MAKSQQTFNKSEKEKKRRKKKQEKAERRAQRKLEKQERGPLTGDQLFSYVDEDGNLSDTPMDPSKKKKIKAEDIMLGVPQRSNEGFDPVRRGSVKYFNDEKGYGFLVDDVTKENIFTHINNIEGEVKQGDRVTFEVEKGPKGLNAVNVKHEVIKPVEKPKPEPKPESKAEDETEDTNPEVTD